MASRAPSSVTSSPAIRCRPDGSPLPALGITVFNVNHALVHPAIVARLALRSRPLKRTLWGVEGPQLVRRRLREGLPIVHSLTFGALKLSDVEEVRRSVIEAALEASGYRRSPGQPQVRQRRATVDRITKPEKLLDPAPTTKGSRDLSEGEIATHQGSLALVGQGPGPVIQDTTTRLEECRAMPPTA